MQTIVDIVPTKIDMQMVSERSIMVKCHFGMVSHGVQSGMAPTLLVTLVNSLTPERFE